MTGRSAAGNLRNFGAMGVEKLETVTHALIREANDPEALFAIAWFQQNRIASAAIFALARKI